MEFALRGGASQDPIDRPCVATLLAGMLDEGAGPLDARSFHRAIEDQAIHLGFGADRDLEFLATYRHCRAMRTKLSNF